MKLLCKATVNGLIPLYDSDAEEKKKLKLGNVYRCTISLPRNYKFHKKFFALLDIVCDNLPDYMRQAYDIYNVENLLDSIKIDLGYYTTENVNGRAVIKLKSIKFSQMDETAFERFYNRTLSLVLKKYLIGTEREDIIEEIENFMR